MLQWNRIEIFVCFSNSMQKVKHNIQTNLWKAEWKEKVCKKKKKRCTRITAAWKKLEEFGGINKA